MPLDSAPTPRLSPEKISAIFNDFAKRAQEDHPRLKNEFLILDAQSGKTYGDFDRAGKYPQLTDEIFAKQMTEHAAKTQKIGSHAFKGAVDMGGWKLQMGQITAYTPQPGIEAVLGREHGEKYALMYTLYHELGHHIVKSAYANYHNDDGRQFAETAADIYALVRMRQAFPDEKPGFFEERVRLMRSFSMVEGGEMAHYTSFAIDELQKRADKIDFAQVTPQQAADLAYAIANKYALQGTTQFALKQAFEPYRAAREKGAEEALQALAQTVLTADAMTFQAGMQYFRPLLEGWAGHPKSKFKGEFWDDMRVKLKTRADNISDPILEGISVIKPAP